MVLGGDNHAFWANDLKPDFDDERAPAVATELIGGSITSHGPDYDATMKIVAQNPHVRFFESRKRGYAIADLTPAAHGDAVPGGGRRDRPRLAQGDAGALRDRKRQGRRVLV